MKSLLLLLLIWSTSLAAVSESWIQENCPKCYKTTDKSFLFMVNGKIIKYSLRTEKLSSERLEIIWEGISDRKGHLSSREIQFENNGEKTLFLKKYRRLCHLFKGYKYYQSSIEFSEGDHSSPADQPTAGVIHLTCFKPPSTGMKKSLNRGVRDLVKFLSGNEEKRSNLNIYDSPRGEERDPANSGRSERAPAASAQSR